MKKIFLFIILGIVFINSTYALTCQYKSTESETEILRKLVYLSTGEIAGNPLEISSVQKTMENISDYDNINISYFDIKNTLPYEIRLRVEYFLEGHGSRLKGFIISLKPNEVQRFREYCSHMGVFGNCSIVENSISYNITEPEYIFSKYVPITREFEVCNLCNGKICLNDGQYCKSNKECGSSFCIQGRCSPNLDCYRLNCNCNSSQVQCFNRICVDMGALNISEEPICSQSECASNYTNNETGLCEKNPVIIAQERKNNLIKSAIVGFFIVFIFGSLIIYKSQRVNLIKDKYAEIKRTIKKFNGEKKQINKKIKKITLLELDKTLSNIINKINNQKIISKLFFSKKLDKYISQTLDEIYLYREHIIFHKLELEINSLIPKKNEYSKLRYTEIEKLFNEKIAFGDKLISYADKYIDSMSKRTKIISKIKSTKSQIENKFKNVIFEIVEGDVHKLYSNSAAILNEITTTDTYLIHNEKMKIISEIDRLSGQISYSEVKLLEKYTSDILAILDNYHNKIKNIKKDIEKYNEYFVSSRKIKYSSLFKKGEHELDEQQKEAIIKDDKYNLVVAGAGSGKTEVLITRIAYLLKRKPDTISSEKILALAFQKKAATEMKERLQKKYDSRVEIRTFHSFGLDILKDNRMPSKLLGGDNNENATKELINKIIEKKLDERDFNNNLINYMKEFTDDNDIIRPESDFKTKKSFYNYMRTTKKYRTLDNTKVKSKGEKEVMNFFLTRKLNGKHIKIKYEEYADWMKYLDKEGHERSPQPDFFLPEYNIYIEFWSFDKNGKLPEWYTGDYKYSMELKKKKYKENPDVELVEVSHGDYETGKLIEILEKRTLTALKKRFPNQKFSFQDISYRELVERVWYDCKAIVGRLPNNILNYITIAKTYRLNPTDLNKKIKENKWTSLQRSFSKIAVEVFSEYEKELKDSGLIDFCDMINKAIDALSEDENFYFDKFDHILIDEFQDISTQRYKLIKMLLDRNPNAKLFCVGDDWQSIMGFAGSNLKYFVEFNKFFPNPEISKLETNYRSKKLIVDVGTEIIQHNIKSENCLQFSKSVVANKKSSGKIEIYKSLNFNYEEHFKDVSNHVMKYIDNLSCNASDILVLSRINLYKNPWLKKLLVPYLRKKGIKFMSVHQSKGLEKKIVFLLNVDKGLYGFPSELENPAILEPAREEIIEERFAEERRLFYVAVTRASERLIIYTRKDKESEFLDSLNKFDDIAFKDINF